LNQGEKFVDGFFFPLVPLHKLGPVNIVMVVMLGGMVEGIEPCRTTGGVAGNIVASSFWSRPLVDHQYSTYFIQNRLFHHNYCDSLGHGHITVID
jgi:hypothetical protein